jgi:hypothetical protein
MSPQIIPLKITQIAGIQPNSGFGDYSRLSCAAGKYRSGMHTPSLTQRRSRAADRGKRH